MGINCHVYHNSLKAAGSRRKQKEQHWRAGHGGGESHMAPESGMAKLGLQAAAVELRHGARADGN